MSSSQANEQQEADETAEDGKTAETAVVATAADDQEMCAALEEIATAGRKGQRSKSSYPQPPSSDYLDSRSVEASIRRHQLRWLRAAASIASPPPSSPRPHEMRASPDKRQRTDSPIDPSV